jgi:hypothetical protein
MLVLALLPTTYVAAYAAPAGDGHRLIANATPSSEDGGADDGGGEDNGDSGNADDGSNADNADNGDEGSGGGEDNNAEDNAGGEDNGDRGEDNGQAGNNNGGDNGREDDRDGGNDDKNKNDKDAKNDDKNKDDKDKDDEDDALDVLGTDCTGSKLDAHNGFEEGPRCVDTSFGEVADEDQSPSLLITESPDTVQAGENFTLTVSTRNLIRDRFLGAAAGGYYKEASFLNEDGIQRGHFHTACRILESTDEAPEPDPNPQFFLATQDNGGGEDPDTVEIPVTGIQEQGTLQCAVWAGDGSHRLPMMQRANQTPAYDVVRITVE